MDSLSMYYKIGEGDIAVYMEKHYYPRKERNNGKLTPGWAADILRDWADEIEDRDLNGDFDKVK